MQVPLEKMPLGMLVLKSIHVEARARALCDLRKEDEVIVCATQLFCLYAEMTRRESRMYCLTPFHTSLGELIETANEELMDDSTLYQRVADKKIREYSPPQSVLEIDQREAQYFRISVPQVVENERLGSTLLTRMHGLVIEENLNGPVAHARMLHYHQRLGKRETLYKRQRKEAVRASAPKQLPLL